MNYSVRLRLRILKYASINSKHAILAAFIYALQLKIQCLVPFSVTTQRSPSDILCCYFHRKYTFIVFGIRSYHYFNSNRLETLAVQFSLNQSDTVWFGLVLSVCIQTRFDFGVFNG